MACLAPAMRCGQGRHSGLPPSHCRVCRVHLMDSLQRESTACGGDQTASAGGGDVLRRFPASVLLTIASYLPIEDLFKTFGVSKHVFQSFRLLKCVLDVTELEKRCISSSDFKRHLRFQLKQWANITGLVLNESGYVCHVVQLLRSVPMLKFLVLKLSALTDAALTELFENESLSKLERLVVRRSRRLVYPKVRCPSLTSLDISQTLVSDAFVTSLAKECPLLENLCMSKCFEVRTWKPLTLLVHLRTLDLSYTTVTDDTIHALLSSLPRLSDLCLDWCGGIEFLPLASDHGSLTRFSASYTRLQDAGLLSVAAHCRNVEEITVRFCKRLHAPHIQLPRLKRLDLTSTHVTEACIERIAEQCASLKVFLVGGTCLYRPTLVSPCIETVDLSETEVGDAEIEAMCMLSPTISALSLNMCSRVTNAQLASPSMTVLDLSRTNVTSATVARLLDNCPALRTLRMHYCTRIFPMRALQHAALEHLQLSCIGLADKDVNLLRFPRLKVLNLRWCLDLHCPKFANLPELRSLDISSTHIGKKSYFLQNLRATCPKLGHLNITNCVGLGVASSHAAVIHKPDPDDDDVGIVAQDGLLNDDDTDGINEVQGIEELSAFAFDDLSEALLQVQQTEDLDAWFRRISRID